MCPARFWFWEGAAARARRRGVTLCAKYSGHDLGGSLRSTRLGYVPCVLCAKRHPAPLGKLGSALPQVYYRIQSSLSML